MYRIRLWSVRHSRAMEWVYARVESALVALHPTFERVGYARLEKPVATLERFAKGLFFDCQMCGQCALSSTGMSCSMNCPKTLRNGPCGGVRDNGHCEVKPEMRCVWVEGFAGSERMQEGRAAFRVVQIALDRRLEGRSSWLIVAREKGQERARLAALKAEEKSNAL